MMFTYVMCSKRCLTHCKPLIRASSDGDDNDDGGGGEGKMKRKRGTGQRNGVEGRGPLDPQCRAYAWGTRFLAWARNAAIGLPFIDDQGRPINKSSLKTLFFQKRKVSVLCWKIPRKIAESPLPSASPAEDRAWALRSQGALGSGLRPL